MHLHFFLSLNGVKARVYIQINCPFQKILEIFLTANCFLFFFVVHYRHVTTSCSHVKICEAKVSERLSSSNKRCGLCFFKCTQYAARIISF